MAGLFGCHDPASERRIRQRTESFNALAVDLNKREAHGAVRCREAVETLDRWERSDVRRFNERLPTVGDYIW